MYVKYNQDRNRNNNSKNRKSYLFIDDIKIYAELDQKLNQLVEAVTEFSEILEWNSDQINPHNVQ